MGGVVTRRSVRGYQAQLSCLLSLCSCTQACLKTKPRLVCFDPRLDLREIGCFSPVLPSLFVATTGPSPCLNGMLRA